jgi:hypothetical protein
LGVKKATKSPQSPETKFEAQNQYGRVTNPSIGNFTWSKEKYTFGGQKGKRAQKRNSGPKSIWSCDRKFYMEKEKNTFRGQKGENEASEPKNGT